MLPPENFNTSSSIDSITEPTPSESSNNTLTTDNMLPLKNHEPKQSFITTENAALLKKYQREIHELTDVTPSFRKLINTLITIENLEIVKTLLINHFK